jgi:hypothetical protein
MPQRELVTASNTQSRSGLSRRDVLATAALVGAGVAVGPGSDMRIGILGSGLMGGKLGTIFARAGHDVVFSYSHSERKLKRLDREAPGRARVALSVSESRAHNPRPVCRCRFKSPYATCCFVRCC